MKEKISITLDDKIVRKIELISKEQGINRSKFIENVLIEKLEKTPVLILAGWTEINKTPKSLLKFEKTPIIVSQITMLKEQGLNNIYVSVSSDALKNYLEENFPEVNVLFENKRLGSGGTLKKFAKIVNSRFLFFHCDVLFKLNLNRLIDFHIQEQSNLTLVLKTKRNPSKYGNAIIEGKKIVDFKEKPKNTETYLVYIGIGVAEPNALDSLDEVGKFELQLSKIRNKIGYIYEGYWKSFEKEEDL